MGQTRLQLTEDILVQVAYGMENQNERLYLDPSGGPLRIKGDGDNRLIPLPPWGPAQGYQLMHRFISTLPDGDLAHRLTEILNSGTGVFRSYKNALAERPEMEKLWRRFKMREMRRTAVSWFSRWSEALDLESLGPEPEGWDEVSLTEFAVRPATVRDMPMVRKNTPQAEPPPAAGRAEHAESDLREGDVLVAESPAGEPVGFALIRLDTGGERTEGRLRQVFVLPEFRGFGVGRMLVERAFQLAADRGATQLSAGIGIPGRLLEPQLEREGFEVVAREWKKTLRGG